MTPEKAKRIIHPDTILDVFSKNFRVACLVACEALEKQIAKVAVIVTKQNLNFAQCPECGRTLFSDKYCGDCGQKVKKAVK